MTPNLLWLFAAFAVGWATVYLYIFSLSRKEREFRHRLALLEKLLSDADPHKSTASVPGQTL